MNWQGIGWTWGSYKPQRWKGSHCLGLRYHPGEMLQGEPGKAHGWRPGWWAPSEHCGLSWCPSWVTCRLGCPHLINSFSSLRSKQFVSFHIVQMAGPPFPAWCGSEGTVRDLTRGWGTGLGTGQLEGWGVGRNYLKEAPAVERQGPGLRDT